VRSPRTPRPSIRYQRGYEVLATSAVYHEGNENPA
jgi:hypothetical protein